MRICFMCLLALLLPLPGYASWGTCSEAVVSPASPEYSWRDVPGHPDQKALYLGEMQVGGVWIESGKYAARSPAGEWELAECPVQNPYAKRCLKCGTKCNCYPKCECDDGASEQPLPTGVIAERVESDKHTICGRPASKQEVMEAIKKASVPSDQNRLRLTLIGEKSRTDAILGDLKAIPETADLVLNAYTPDHWAVTDVGLAAGQPFSITLQAPDGEVLHRQADYEGGITALAEAVRKVRADWDASQAPDRRNTSLSDGLPTLPPVVWIGGAVLVILLLMRKD